MRCVTASAEAFCHNKPMLQRACDNFRARYPEAPAPHIAREEDEDGVWEEYSWDASQTGRGCEVSLTVTHDNLIEIYYPGVIGGFDEYSADDPCLVSQLASQFYPDEPWDHGVFNTATADYLVIYPDPHRFYPHRFIGSSLVDPWSQEAFARLYPDVVKAVGEVEQLWSPPDKVDPEYIEGCRVATGNVLEEHTFTQGEPKVARWFEHLRQFRPHEYRRWAAMWKELPESPRQTCQVMEQIPDTMLYVPRRDTIPWDHDILRTIYCPRAWLDRNHPDATVRRVVAFLRTVERGEPIVDYLTPRQIRAVTQRTRVVFRR